MGSSGALFVSFWELRNLAIPDGAMDALEACEISLQRAVSQG